MARAGPFKRKGLSESVRRRLDMAAATAWQDIVDAHVDHALRFVGLMQGRVHFDAAIRRYLDEMDVRDPMASAIRSRALIALEAYPVPVADTGADPGHDEEIGGLHRFRPDVLVKGIKRRVRETDEEDQWVALAIARAEEAIIGVHIDNALTFSRLPRDQGPLHDRVEDYIAMMRITGGRAQAVFQRTMARLADLHLPDESGSGTAR